MNFSELKTEFFARGFDSLNEDAQGVSRAERWINQAYREILNLHAWPFLQASASGVNGTVSIPDLRRIRFVVDTSGVGTGTKLNRVSLDDLVADGVTDTARTGTPEWYYVDAGNIVKSYPVGSALTVYYIKRVDPLSGTDTPIFDEEYHNLIIDKAVVKAYIDSDNFEAAAALKQEYDAGVSAMAEDYLLDSREVQFIRVEPYDG